ncbi:MAG: FAD-dependent oxidoreductase [Candidatus Kariarchaeaceae archaeon]|jgi:NADPH-dependent glutamate synthase beta subunit-like oxidoreductase
MQVGFHFDQTRCAGCNACRVACKDWHDQPSGSASWMRINYFEEGPFPNVFAGYLISNCYQCEEPVCSYICPNEALSKRDKDGIVVVDKEKCREEVPCGIISKEKMGGDYSYGESQAPCQTACPVNLRIPAYTALIAKSKFKESLALIRQRMPLPSVCGRVCLHPCEEVCARKEVDQAIAIEALKGFVADNVSEELPKPISQTQSEKVAIIGSGPAGLAAAYDLIRLGYGVTVFEALSSAGGMLAVGIPDYRLPRDILNRDIDYIKALGVDIKTNTAIDLDQGLEDLLKQGYGAVLVAIGAHKGKKLGIPGTDLDNVLVGTSFMRDVNLGKEVKLGKKVMVIGGGNVAMDCARTAKRLGAAEVGISCLECFEDMPADITEVEQAREEGIEIYDSRTFTKLASSDGKVSGVGCLEITGCTFDDDGEAHFDVVSDEEHTLEADTVIFAIGQVPEIGNSGIVKISKMGTIDADSDTLMIGTNRVFVAGDCYSGVASIIDAIASGQKSASKIHRYLQGDVLRERPLTEIAATEIKVDIPSDVVKKDRQTMPLLSASERSSNFKEVTLGFSEEAAISEAERCLNCAGHLCKDVCPYSAPQFVEAEKTRMQKCNYCVDRFDIGKQPICVEACYARALDSGTLDELKSKYGEIQESPGFSYSISAKPSIVFKPKKK